MKPEIIQTIIDKWTSSNENTRNALMKHFLENNGDFSYQREWLLFLAEAFGISKNTRMDQLFE